MYRWVCALVMIAGCAGTSEYRPGPPVTVREPTFSGPVTPPPRLPAPQQYSSQPPFDPSVAPTPCQEPSGSRFMNWLRSGTGWTWGAARYGPVRDEGLDRLMMDTLTSGRPQYSLEPVEAPAARGREGPAWVYPQGTGGRAPQFEEPPPPRKLDYRSPTQQGPPDEFQQTEWEVPISEPLQRREPESPPRSSPRDQWKPAVRDYPSH